MPVGKWRKFSFVLPVASDRPDRKHWMNLNIHLTTDALRYVWPEYQFYWSSVNPPHAFGGIWKQDLELKQLYRDGCEKRCFQQRRLFISLKENWKGLNNSLSFYPIQLIPSTLSLPQRTQNGALTDSIGSYLRASLTTVEKPFHWKFRQITKAKELDFRPKSFVRESRIRNLRIG